MRRRKILFLTQLLPYPLNSGGKITTFKTIKYLAEHNDLDLVCYAWSRKDWNYVDLFRKMTKKFVMIDLKRKPLFPYFLLHNFTRKPHYIFRDFSVRMKKSIHKLIKKRAYDLIYSDLFMVPYIPSDFKEKKILEKLNIESEIVRRFRSLQKNPIKKLLLHIESINLLNFELQSSDFMDITITLTERDKQNLAKFGADISKIKSIPPATKIDEAKPFKLDCSSKNIVHIGTAHWPPNVDGISWFIKDIFPKVISKIPEAKLQIIGKEPPKKIQSLHNGKNIFVLGYVEDLREIYKHTGVFIVPIRIGSGIRIKIIETMSYGIPIVSTSIGCEGIGAKNGEHLLIADSEKDFANAVIRLLENHELREKMRTNGRKYVTENFSLDKRTRMLNGSISGWGDRFE